MAGSIYLDINSGASREQSATLDDLQLVDALKEGQEQAYETLLLRFQQPVYTLALRLLNDRCDACDVVQEVFLKVFRNIGQFRGQSSLRTWIYRITVNEAHNQRRWFFRHRHREVCLEPEADSGDGAESLPDVGRSPFDYAVNQERQALIQDALARINPAFREAVVLRDISDLSYEEISQVLRISLGTVKSRILRGREALRQELAGRLQPEPSLAWAPKPVESIE